MPTFRRYPNVGSPYLVTTTVKARQPLFVERAYCEIVAGCIQYLRTNLGHQVHAFVIMPDHIHLVVTPKAGNTVSQVMHTLKLYTARQIDAIIGSKGGIWQPRFYERALRTARDLEQALTYVHNNPVKAGLTDSPEQYYWSSYRACLLGQPVPIGIDPVSW